MIVGVDFNTSTIEWDSDSNNQILLETLSMVDGNERSGSATTDCSQIKREFRIVQNHYQTIFFFSNIYLLLDWPPKRSNRWFCVCNQCVLCSTFIFLFRQIHAIEVTALPIMLMALLLFCVCVYVYVFCKYSANGFFFSFVYMHTRTRSRYTIWTRSALDGCKHLFLFSLFLGLTIIWNCLRRNILQYFFFIFTFSPYYTICLLLHFPYKKNKEITLEFFRFLSFLGLYPT